MQKRSTGSYTVFFKVMCALLSIILITCSCSREEEPPIDINNSSLVPGANVLPDPDVEDDVPTADITMNLPVFGSMHPLEEQTKEVKNFFSLIFEPAVMMKSNGEFVSCVIDNWTISSNEREYIFRVRSNVTFHDPSYGTVTADDIIFCIEYIRGSETASLHEYSDGIESIEKLSDNTIKIVTAEKKHNLFDLLGFYVIPKAYYENKDKDTDATPIGTGPYKVESMVKEESALLQVNSTWWKNSPDFRSIRFIKVDPKDIYLGSDKISQFDILYTEDYTNGSLISDRSKNFYTIHTSSLYCLIPNVYNPVMSKKDARKAVAYGINRNRLINSAMLGLGEATFTPLNDSYWALNVYEETTANHDSLICNQYLKNLGYSTEDDEESKWMSVSILYCSSAYTYDLNKMIAECIADDLRSNHIKVNLIGKEKEEYEKTLESGSFQLALCVIDTSEDNDLTQVFNEYNYGHFFNKDLMTAMYECRRAINNEDIKEKYSKLQGLVDEEMPIIGLFFEENLLLTSRKISITEKLMYDNIFFKINEWSYLEG